MSHAAEWKAERHPTRLRFVEKSMRLFRVAQMTGAKGRNVTNVAVTAALFAGLMAPWAQLLAQDARTVAAKPPTILVSPGPRAAAFSGSRLIDIPEWAKAEGHNGWVVWTVRVGASGLPLSTTIKRSSGSSAIDEAAKTRLDSGRFLPATNKEGEKLEAELELQFYYFKWNPDGNAGGLKGYTCADLVREYDWFSRTNMHTRLLFPLQNYYTSLRGVADIMNARTSSLDNMHRQHEQREKMWSKLVETCRKHPTALFLDQVDRPDLFIALARM